MREHKNFDKNKFIKKNKYKIVVYSLVAVVVIVLGITLVRRNFTNNDIKSASNSSYENIDKSNKKINDNIKPNEAGDIMVVMYHSISQKSNHYQWHRSKSEFWDDLEYMYKHNYVLVSMKEYLSNDIDIPRGKTPILLTFDDGLKSTFAIIKNKMGRYVLNPDSLIGILEEFKRKHPDFGSGGVLYVTANPFENDAFHNTKTEGSYYDKFKYLTSLGYEIGNHTYHHYDLSTLSSSSIKEEAGKVNKMVSDSYNGYQVKYFAYPYGNVPSNEKIKVIKKGQYKGISYKHESAVLAGPRSPYFTNPITKDFNAYKIPRTIASSGANQDMYWYFKYYEKHKNERYISDGDRSKLSISSKMKNEINKKKIEGFNVEYVE